MSRKRRIYPESLKAKVALEAVKGVKSIAEISSTYNVHPTVIAQWKKQLIAEAPSLFLHGNAKKESGGEEMLARLYAGKLVA